MIRESPPLQIRNSLCDSIGKQNLHPWVRVDQAVRPPPPKTLSILVGLGEGRKREVCWRETSILSELPYYKL